MSLVTRVAVPVESVPGGATNAYLVGESPALLVDPADRTTDLDAAVEARDVSHVAVTHHHRDHVCAVAAYASETDATVWAREGHTGEFERATGREPDRTLAEGTAIPVAGGVTALATPGHAPEHLAFETDRGILCGDLARATGSVAVAAPDGDVRTYLETLRRLRARAPPTLFPGHGPEISAVAETLDRLVDHRLERECRVLDAVEAGADDVESVLERAYDEDLTGVRDLARATVRAHLEKLAAEGRVVFDEETGTVSP